MKEFRDYDIKYPELIIDILEYFGSSHDNPNKSSIDFSINYKRNADDKSPMAVVPWIVSRICDIICSKNHLMMCDKRDGGDGSRNKYSYAIRCSPEVWAENRDFNNHYFSSLVYGFEYIQRRYLDIVKPLLSIDSNGDQSMGTCFKFLKGIVTAKHCLVDGDSVAIKGYDADKLNDALVCVSANDAIDVAYIHLGEGDVNLYRNPKVLDEVLVMGFPMIPRFHNFVTSEKATVSSIADLRMTPSRGAVAAMAPEMFSKTELMLITAKIKGGNSGGPVINNEGCIIGVAVSDPKSEGNSYDNLGYGIAFPIQSVLDMIQEHNIINVNFVNYPYDDE